jgi:hypothetical protein
VPCSAAAASSPRPAMAPPPASAPAPARGPPWTAAQRPRAAGPRGLGPRSQHRPAPRSRSTVDRWTATPPPVHSAAMDRASRELPRGQAGHGPARPLAFLRKGPRVSSNLTRDPNQL